MSDQSGSSLSNPTPRFRWWTIALTAALALLTALFVTVCAQAQALNYFADLKAGNASGPYASVVQGADGNCYGAGTGGIDGGGGNMFRITPTGEIRLRPRGRRHSIWDAEQQFAVCRAK